jgi:hypothetical protein
MPQARFDRLYRMTCRVLDGREPSCPWALAPSPVKESWWAAYNASLLIERGAVAARNAL